MSKPKEHLVTIDQLISKIEREVNWMGIDGHLDSEAKMESVNDISLACHKARNELEKTNK